jgi:hypothetical protein
MMPFYRVVVRQDAWINHEGYVEANAAEEAAYLGLAAWKGQKTLDVPLRPTGESDGFDEAICEPEDCEEITSEEFRSEVELQNQLKRQKPSTTA